MVDTGASINVIKKRSLHPDTSISTTKIFSLTGITRETITTLGSAVVYYIGYPILLHVVPDNFPIVQEGILGTVFLRGASNIDFDQQVVFWQNMQIPFAQRETVVVPARSRATFHVKVKNTDITEGYVPRLKFCAGIYAGEGVVKNRNGRAYVQAINTSEEDRELIVPTVELLEIDAVSTSPVRSASLSHVDQSTTSADSKAVRGLAIPNLVDGRSLRSPVGQQASSSVDESETILGRASRSLVNQQSCDSDSLQRTHQGKVHSSLQRTYKGEVLPSPQRTYQGGKALSNPEVQVCAINSESKTSERIQNIRELLRLEHLNQEETKHVDALVERHNDLFRLPEDKLGHTSIFSHKINTIDDVPIHTKQYRFPPIHRDEINKQVGELLDNDIISPSDSPYNSPLWIVPKKPDSNGSKRWRMVIDYRALNEKTVGDAYPLPNITDILDQLGSSKYFSVLDLASGFHQIPMQESDAAKTAFSTPYGHYQFNRMPFGLKNAPATFQRLMDRVLTGLQGIEVFVYMDDIVVYARSLREHEIKFNKLAQRLRAANLHLQPDKCEFLRTEVTYLGHIISNDGVKPDPKKISAVKDFPTPKRAKNVKQFLGLAGYYRRFIPDFSKIAKPLTKLLKKNMTFVWEREQEEAFQRLRDALCSQPLLQYPDFTQPFVLTTDASGYAVGGVLSQGVIGKDLPVAYASRLLNPAEQNYSTIEKELLAIVHCVRHFRPYLYGRKFKLVTDHRPLVWLHSVKDPTSRLVRWRLKLAEYDYEVLYKAGKINANADALSRNPTPSSQPHTVHVLPVDVSSHCEPGPSRIRKKHQTTINDEDNGHETVSDIGTSENDDGNGDETSVASSDGEEESDSVNQPRSSREHQQFILNETEDNFILRKDNLVVFVTRNGTPCDKGATMLQDAGLLPQVKDAALGRAQVTKNNNRNIISLVVKERQTDFIEPEVFNEAINSLLDVIRELGLDTISVCRTSIGRISYRKFHKQLCNTLADTNVQVTVCSGDTNIPPADKRQDIIDENHSSAVGGHKGVTKTYLRIKPKYSWPNMKKDVQNFIQKCRNCQLKKLVRVKTRQPMVLTDTPDAAFDKVSMDIMGPLPTTSSGNNYVLTIQDLLTKYSLAVPLRGASAIDVAEAFVNELVCVYGAPKAVLTDQGTHFLNSLVRAVAKKFRIKQYHTTAYRPQANGSIERSHHVLWEYLKQFVSSQQEWDECLKLACFSYNTSVHEATRYTPFELVYGRLARTPTSNPSISDITNESYTEYLTTLFSRLKDVQVAARQNLIRAKEKSKLYYDKRVNPEEFQVGDKVYLLREPNRGKLGDQYVGPYDVIETLANHNIKVKVGANKHRIVHEDKIRKCKQVPTPA